MEKLGTGDVIDHHGGRLLVECQVCWKQWSWRENMLPAWDKCPSGCKLDDLPVDRRGWLKRYE